MAKPEPDEVAVKVNKWIMAAGKSGARVELLAVVGGHNLRFVGHYEKLLDFFHEAQDKVLDNAPPHRVTNAGEIPKELSFDETPTS